MSDSNHTALRPLGRTGLLVSRLGLGLAALGRPGYINLGHAQDLHGTYDVATMQAQTFSVLDAAWDRGVRYFDAARSYGRAEEFLDAWLRERRVPETEITVGSKWGYTYTADWHIHADRHEVKDHSAPVLRRQSAESRALLGDYLRLYQIHSATLESGVLENQPVLDELAHLRDAGLVLGVTLSGAKQSDTLRRALEIRRGGALLFGTAQATWNLLERSAGSALAEAHQAGMGVIVKEGLANGRLTERNQDPAFTSQRRLLGEIAAERNTTIDAVALAAILAQPWTDVVLSGAAIVAHLCSNLAALEVAWSAEIDARLAVLAEPAEEYWRTRGELAWN